MWKWTWVQMLFLPAAEEVIDSKFMVLAAFFKMHFIALHLQHNRTFLWCATFWKHSFPIHYVVACAAGWAGFADCVFKMAQLKIAAGFKHKLLFIYLFSTQGQLTWVSYTRFEVTAGDVKLSAVASKQQGPGWGGPSCVWFACSSRCPRLCTVHTAPQKTKGQVQWTNVTVHHLYATSKVCLY